MILAEPTAFSTTVTILLNRPYEPFFAEEFKKFFVGEDFNRLKKIEQIEKDFKRLRKMFEDFK